MRLIEVEKVELSDGNMMPLLGLGTSRTLGNKPNEIAYEAVKTAIKAGYRLIDTAFRYRNEEAVGNAITDCIRENIVRREELFICTKLWNTAHKRESVKRACSESLKRLQLDYVDLYLIHWPIAYQEGLHPICPKDPVTGEILFSDTHYTETWMGMQEVKELGLARSIGVSNFNHLMLDELYNMPDCKHKPVVNQVECHPYLNQKKMQKHCAKLNITMIAYCPLGSPKALAKADQERVLDNWLVKELAQKYNKSPAQILLRFLVQRKICTIPKSVTPNRIRENIDVFNFELSQQDLDKLLTLDKKLRYCTYIGGETIDYHPFHPFNIEY